MATNQNAGIKEYRETKLGRRLGIGREAEVFEWQPGWVIKLFYKRTIEKVNYEFRINELIHKTGLAVPATKEVTGINNRLGIVFERLKGKSMLDDMSQRPWKFFIHARNLAIIHSLIHRNSLLSLSDQKFLFIERIRSVRALNEQIKDQALDIINMLPDDQQLCHGDYHPDNIIATQFGFKIIDWTTATVGNPVADVALTSIILKLGEVQQGTPYVTRWMINIGRHLFHRLYIFHYFKLNPKFKKDFGKWLFPIAIVRLSYNIEGEREKLITLIEKLGHRYSK